VLAGNTDDIGILDGRICGRSSTTVTSEPCGRTTRTHADRARAHDDERLRHHGLEIGVQTSFPSGSMPGSTRGRAPVAIILGSTWGAREPAGGFGASEAAAG